MTTPMHFPTIDMCASNHAHWQANFAHDLHGIAPETPVDNVGHSVDVIRE
jgi:hypothetical protein